MNNGFSEEPGNNCTYCCPPAAVSGSTLLPSAPVLTRYSESMNPFAKRKLIEPTVPEEKVTTKLNNLTVPKLCVKLNTLQVSFELTIHSPFVSVCLIMNIILVEFESPKHALRVQDMVLENLS
jgi:hypothetical protein